MEDVETKVYNLIKSSDNTIDEFILINPYEIDLLKDNNINIKDSIIPRRFDAKIYKWKSFNV